MYDLLIAITIIVPVCGLQALPHRFSDFIPKHRYYSGNASIIKILILNGDNKIIINVDNCVKKL